MPSLVSSQFDPHSNLVWIYDAVHGSIDIRDTAGSSELGIITKLLSSPILERLRRLKQLAFASQTYPAADYNRYAHAIGTMHMMRMVLKRLFTVDGFTTELFKSLKTCFPNIFSGLKASDYDILVQHMLVAGLLQDVGYLPYQNSTKFIYKPSYELRESVKNLIGFEVKSWTDKTVFTIACLYDERIQAILEDLDIPFLVFLLTGLSLSPEVRLDTNLIQLCHIMDGVVDADRLDYVFRDAHHTVGGLGNPNAVVDTLLYYDEQGPVFSDPGPVSNFLVTRAHLCSTVYYAPAPRFRTLLLLTLLQGIARKEECTLEFFDKATNWELSFEDFLELDDISLTARITAFNAGITKRRLDNKARSALEIFLGRGSGYQCLWLHPEESPTQSNDKINLPDDLFFDTFSDVDQRKYEYEASSVRIRADRFKSFDIPTPLEKCGGPFSAILKESWSVLPLPTPGSILLFIPKKQAGGSWNEFYRAIDGKWLYDTLLAHDPFGQIDFPSDTRNKDGFTGPDIFISFAWADIKVVKKVSNSLNKKRKKYHLFAKPFQGIGSTPSKNSTEAVEHAGVVLILVSSNYVARYREAPDGYIAKEVFAMSRRVKVDGLKIIILSADDFSEIKDKLPWSQLGLDETPFTGKPLRYASDSEVDDAIDEMLKVIEQDHGK